MTQLHNYTIAQLHNYTSVYVFIHGFIPSGCWVRQITFEYSNNGNRGCCVHCWLFTVEWYVFS
jgi:hypothetical protein